MISGGEKLKLWNVVSGLEVRSLAGHQGLLTSVAFWADGRKILSGSKDGTVRLWETKTGEEIAAFVTSPEREELTFTQAGFFSSSRQNTKLFVIVRGVEPTAFSQVHQSLYSPDLVRETLAGDPTGSSDKRPKSWTLIRFSTAGPRRKLKFFRGRRNAKPRATS